MASRPEKTMTCSTCLETLSKPMKLSKNGRMCDQCLLDNHNRTCPTCRATKTKTRCYQMGQMLEDLQNTEKSEPACRYTSKGCKFILSRDGKEAHEAECKFRKFKCEGKKFAKWKCNWAGDYNDLYDHFKTCHDSHTWMEFSTEASMKISFERDITDIQIISFLKGKHYFYYKNKVDVVKEKVYWLFQLIGTKNQAHNYYYEFEVHLGPTRKAKYTEICESDTVDANALFEEERCAVMSFAAVKTFLNRKRELPFKFRIMSIKRSPLY